jgi:hypothetical protein
VVDECPKLRAIGLGPDALRRGTLCEGERDGAIGAQRQRRARELDLDDSRNSVAIAVVGVEDERLVSAVRVRGHTPATEAVHLDPFDGDASRGELVAPHLQNTQMVASLGPRERSRRARAPKLALTGRLVVCVDEGFARCPCAEQNFSQEERLVSEVGFEELVLARRGVLVILLVEAKAKPRPGLQWKLEKLHDRVERHGDARAGVDRDLGERREQKMPRELGPGWVAFGARQDLFGCRSLALHLEILAKSEGTGLGAGLRHVQSIERKGGLAPSREEIWKVRGVPATQRMSAAQRVDVIDVPERQRVKKLLHDRGGRDSLPRHGVARNVRKRHAIARRHQELQKRIAVGFARSDVGFAPLRPAQIERVIRLGRRKPAFAKPASEDHAKGERSQCRQRRERYAFALRRAHDAPQSCARELGGYAIAHGPLAEVALHQSVQAPQGAGKLLLLGLIRRRHVRLDERAQKPAPRAERELGPTRKPCVFDQGSQKKTERRRLAQLRRPHFERHVGLTLQLERLALLTDVAGHERAERQAPEALVPAQNVAGDVRSFVVAPVGAVHDTELLAPRGPPIGIGFGWRDERVRCGAQELLA